MISLVSPAIVIAVAIYITFLQWRLTGSLFGYVFAHAAIGMPFVLVAVTSALGGLDPKLSLASASLGAPPLRTFIRSEEHTSELQSLMRISYAVFCLKKKQMTIIT